MTTSFSRLLRWTSFLIVVAVLLGTFWDFLDESRAADAVRHNSAGQRPPKPEPPSIAAASREGELAIQRFQIPKGMKVELIAAEPKLANPVAFCIDAKGRFYVCETFRQERAVADNRKHKYWLHDDLAAQTVEDRFKYFKKHLGQKKLDDFTKQDDRIRLLWDSTGDGKLDRSTVFADRFNAVLEGTGAGVLAYRGDVFFTCIPKLWKLRDLNNDGVADKRTALHHGYGVRVAFRGHDLHGLTMGPDGLLYFSIGDRGFNVVTQEGKRLKRPGTGAVFRCELDGSHLELFAYGLRNPQDLAFDNFGNLFTCDNNSDSGDRARWVYVVQGGDTGWRMHYQYLKDRGPWNREMIWYPHDAPALKRKGPGNVPVGTVAADRQPAYTVPPVKNFADGPSGLTFYPGVGLSKRYQNHFFLADFRGGHNTSGIRSFSVQPKGAGFRLTDPHTFIGKILATDVNFGYDGNVYVSDWVRGWQGVGKGRIYRFSDPKFSGVKTVAKGKQPGKQPAKKSVAEIMRNGMSKSSTAQLAQWLEHADRRVRLEAQFELVRRHDWKTLKLAVEKPGNIFRRLHGLWGLGQIQRQQNRFPQNQKGLKGQKKLIELLAWKKETFQKLANDAAPEFRAHFLTLLAEVMKGEPKKGRQPTEIELMITVTNLLVQGLTDKNSRVRYFTLQAFAQTGWFEMDWPPIIFPELKRIDRPTALVIQLLAQNANQDPYLRHAGVMALVTLCRNDVSLLQKFSKSQQPVIRLAALLALRRIAWDRQQTVCNLALKKTAAKKTKPNKIAMTQQIEVNNLLKPFFHDADPKIVTEAARAMDELDSIDLMAELAKVEVRAGLPDALLRRVLNANFRGGRSANAAVVARVASDSRFSETLRLEAIAELKLWNQPPPLDRVTGAWRPISVSAALRKIDVAAAIRPYWGGILSGSQSVRQAGMKMAAAHGVKSVAPLLLKIFTDRQQPGNVRAESLRALSTLNSKKIDVVIQQAIADRQPLVRTEGRRLFAQRSPQKAVPLLERAIANGETVEKQGAVSTLAAMKLTLADAVLEKWMQRLTTTKKVPSEIQLDLLLAAKKRGTKSLRNELANWKKLDDKKDPLSAYRATLAGGNVERGRELFFGRVSLSCVRCHTVNQLGGNVGPDLSAVGITRTRNHLLEAILLPNRQITKGYDGVVLAMENGKTYSGTMVSQTKTTLTLRTATGEMLTVKKSEIEVQAKGSSAMPNDLIKQLTHSELRDLIEFLASLKKKSVLNHEGTKTQRKKEKENSKRP